MGGGRLAEDGAIVMWANNNGVVIRLDRARCLQKRQTRLRNAFNAIGQLIPTANDFCDFGFGNSVGPTCGRILDRLGRIFIQLTRQKTVPSLHAPKFFSK